MSTAVGLSDLDESQDPDAVTLAVPSKTYVAIGAASLSCQFKPSGILVDIKSVLSAGDLPSSVQYYDL